MRRKLGILGLLVLLICAVIGSQKAGEYLYQNYLNNDAAETSASTGTKEKKTVVVDAGHGGYLLRKNHSNSLRTMLF